MQDLKLNISVNLGDFYTVERRYQQAIALLEPLVGQYESRVDASYGLAATLLALAEAYTKSGRLGDAYSTLTRAKELVAAQNDFYLNGVLQYHTAALLRAKQQYGEAVSEYERVVNLIEGMRTGLAGTSRLNISGAYEFVYDELLDALHAMYSRAPNGEKPLIAAKAFRICELDKAREFTESLGSAYLRLGAPEIPLDLLRRERSVILRRQSLLSRLSEITHDRDFADKKTVLSQLRATEEEIQSVITTLRKDFPAYAALRYPMPIDVGDLRLADGDLVVEYKTGAEATFVLVLAKVESKASVQGFYKLPITANRLSQLVQSFRRPFSNVMPSDYNANTSEELFRAVLAEVDEQLIRRSRRVVIIPDGDLYQVPFDALSPRVSAGEYIFDSIPVLYFPSATAMALAEGRGKRIPASGILFALGDPVSDPNDERILLATAQASKVPSAGTEHPGAEDSSQNGFFRGLRSSGFSFHRLPATKQEVEVIQRTLLNLGGDIEIKLGFEATKTNLLATDLGRFRFLHFATHGVLPSEVPSLTEPGLVLSLEGNDPHNMFLSMSDVLGLKLNAEVVTLSACETGLGKNLHAEGLIGLPRAFMFAGASSVVVSLWKVADDSTVDLMKEFYSRIAAGTEKALALSLAKHKVRAMGKTNPFFWAPFIMWGE